MRVTVTLQCTESGDRTYITTKNKRNNPERLELKKYSPRLKKYTLHRETKQLVDKAETLFSHVREKSVLFIVVDYLQSHCYKRLGTKKPTSRETSQQY